MTKLETPWQILLSISVGRSAAQASRSDQLRQAANPASNLSRRMFQYRHYAGLAEVIRRHERQVIPFSRNANWRVIFRAVIPFVSFNGVPSGTEKTSGIGNILKSCFLLPKQPTAGELVWDVGPVFQLPTLTVDRLGPGQFGSVIAAVAVSHNIGRSREQGATGSPSLQSVCTSVGDDWSMPVSQSVAQSIKIGRSPVLPSRGLRYWAISLTAGCEGWRTHFGVI